MARYTTNGLPWGHGLGKDVTDDESDSICQGLAYIKMFT